PALTIVPNPALVGETVTVTYAVVNAGSLAVRDVTATLWATSGAALLALRTGPVSGTVTIATGETRTFRWTFSATGGGLVDFTATASGLDVNGEAILAAPRSGTLEITPLRATLAAFPSPGMVGAWEEARLTVENVGPVPVTGLTVSLSLTGGAALLSSRLAPASAAVTLGARSSQSFTWRYNAEDAGTVTLSVTAEAVIVMDPLPA
ncbi:MAG: hypothetical protein AAB368_05350, partial [bacterium]